MLVVFLLDFLSSCRILRSPNDKDLLSDVRELAFMRRFSKFFPQFLKSLSRVVFQMVVQGVNWQANIEAKDYQSRPRSPRSMLAAALQVVARKHVALYSIKVQRIAIVALSKFWTKVGLKLTGCRTKPLFS